MKRLHGEPLCGRCVPGSVLGSGRARGHPAAPDPGSRDRPSLAVER
ncbi:hypothetical protein APASM_4739 [Actinosynnema pretiosum subsp. pretiosum]|nr:hypothetical protein APASM_4739 [Actinosynnema pretiosum subsp. pretiosum]